MKRPRSILRGCGCTSVVALLALVLLSYVLADSNPLGHFRSPQGEREYKQAYQAAMATLPQPNRTLDIAISYGVVRVYEFGPPNAAGVPVVLLPGRTSGVPMWSSNLKDLAAQRKVYALDALGDAGFSTSTRPIESSSDQARWLEETFAQLGLPRAHLVGHSFGGWLAANYALQFPARVQSLTLLEPVFVFQGLRPQVYAVTIPAALPFLPRSWRERMLSEIGGGGPIDHSDPITRMITAATDHYAVQLPLPDRITGDQLRALAMPVYVALGARSFMHNSAEAQHVAQTSVRNLRIRTWPDATHSLPMEEAASLDLELLRFFREHDARP